MKNFRIGSVLGIPIQVNISWLIPAAAVTWFLAVEVYPDVYEEGNVWAHVAMAVASAILFFLSLIFHELAHSVVALWYRVPVRSITLFLLGGVAQITREPRKPVAELLIAVAGPLSSLVLGLAFFSVWWVTGRSADNPVSLILAWLAGMNIIIAIFNILPIFPMDGGRVFRSLIWLVTGNPTRATLIAAWSGRVVAWSLIGAAVLAVAGVEMWIIRGPLDGIWFLLIGFFLESATRQSLNQVRLVQALNAYRTSDLMVPNPPVIDIQRTIESLARGVLELNPRICYFVESEGRLAGLVSAYQMRQIPEAAWGDVTAADVMVPRDKLTATAPDALLSDVLLEMEHDDLLHMPVVENNEVVGVIGRDRILSVLRQAGLIGSVSA